MKGVVLDRKKKKIFKRGGSPLIKDRRIFERWRHIFLSRRKRVFNYDIRAREGKGGGGNHLSRDQSFDNEDDLRPCAVIIIFKLPKMVTVSQFCATNPPPPPPFFFAHPSQLTIIFFFLTKQIKLYINIYECVSACVRQCAFTHPASFVFCFLWDSRREI